MSEPAGVRRRQGSRLSRRDVALRRAAAAAVALAVLAFIWALFQPFAGDGGDRVPVLIPKRASASEIGDLLDRKKVVASAALFELRATLAGNRGDLKPGPYVLREGMSYGDVIDRLVAGPSSDVVRFTIPEGLSRREIVPLVKKAGIAGDYLKASADRSLVPFTKYGAKQVPDSLEGFLFPATYEFKRTGGVGTLVSQQVAAFRQRLASISLSDARKKNLTVYDVVTIASMVEREAHLARERPLIAAVIYNRLHAGQPLGIDATTRYATGNWSKPLTQSELALDSPYNTRKNAGLPPGPIGNPGLDSLDAAAHPANVDYLYYVVKPGTCGEHAFSSTPEQFERDRQRYEAAREAAGGSPTSC
jgi:peptidoglycan lytic transglycosylase G